MAYKLAVRGEFHTVMHVHSNPSLSTHSPVSTTSDHFDYAPCFSLQLPCTESHHRYLNAKPAQTVSKAVSYKLTVLYCLVQEALVKKAELDRQKHVLLEKQVEQQKVRIVA